MNSRKDISNKAALTVATGLANDLNILESSIIQHLEKSVTAFERTTHILSSNQINEQELEYITSFVTRMLKDFKTIDSILNLTKSLIGVNATITPVHKTLPSGHKLLIGDNSLIEL